MAYKLVYTRTTAHDIQRLDTVVRKKIKKKIEVYCKNPLFFSKKLVSEEIGKYRWRIGDYRVVFDMDNKNIVILRIEHRREIYR